MPNRNYRYLIIALLFIPSLCFGGFLINPFGTFGDGGSPGSTADIMMSLDDNTTGTSVAVSGTGTASLSGESNTSDVHTTDSVEGTGAFALDTNDVVYLSGVNFCDDAICTIEFAIKGDQTGTADYARLFTDGNTKVLITRYAADTSFRAAYNGVTLIATVDDMDDGAWHYFRVVYDINGTNSGKTIIVYQGSSPATLAEKGSLTDALTASTLGTINIFSDGSTAWGNASGGNKGDHVRIWNSVVTP